MRILALSGSLRAASVNSALLRAAARLAPSDVSVTVFDDAGNLPLFNPDRDADHPAIVVRFRSQLASADALMIATMAAIVVEGASVATSIRESLCALSDANKAP
jgi:NAD(P)H-dependent FMN reductase